VDVATGVRAEQPHAIHSKSLSDGRDDFPYFFNRVRCITACLSLWQAHASSSRIGQGRATTPGTGARLLKNAWASNFGGEVIIPKLAKPKSTISTQHDYHISFALPSQCSWLLTFPIDTRRLESNIEARAWFRLCQNPVPRNFVASKNQVISATYFCWFRVSSSAPGENSAKSRKAQKTLRDLAFSVIGRLGQPRKVCGHRYKAPAFSTAGRGIGKIR
jgi:hypothetical protein